MTRTPFVQFALLSLRFLPQKAGMNAAIINVKFELVASEVLRSYASHLKLPMDVDRRKVSMAGDVKLFQFEVLMLGDNSFVILNLTLANEIFFIAEANALLHCTISRLNTSEFAKAR